MKNFLLSIAALIAPAFVYSIVPPGADTPEFYLVASSASNPANLLPVRTEGGSGGYATLTGTGSIGKFYFYQGALTGAPRTSSSSTLRPLIGSVLGATGCSTYGALGFTEGSSSNKCARYSSFYLQSNPENSQLGARLTFNWVGGFYACGSGQDVWYKVNPSDGGPSDCSPIDLYTVPVV
ncbi:GPI-anchored small secreted protein [Crucibulum laeve]|uniref:GPI-anchored small secreted protein n=1 Tax=Crucibulum laeve TaxID=68775 RepID=A0A5C3LUN8_9AGAR|nr:GPI-anchored small secreted protein [Crucibulum laeve]